MRFGMMRGDQSLSIVASQQEISLKTGCCRNTLTSAANELVTGNWIEAPTQRRAKRGELATNEYFLLNRKDGPTFGKFACETVFHSSRMHNSKTRNALVAPIYEAGRYCAVHYFALQSEPSQEEHLPQTITLCC